MKFLIRKKRKQDEVYLWAELKGNEAQIKELLEEQNKIRRKLSQHLHKRERLQQIAGEVS